MEEHEKRHIRQNLSRLVETTNCNTTFMALLIQNGVLGISDRAHLDSMQNEMKKAYEFYHLVMTKKDAFAYLVAALEESRQTGALAILNRLGGSSNPPFDSVVERNNYRCTVGHFETSNSIRFDVLPPVRLFTGRINELSEIHDKLQQGSTKKLAVISQMVSIVGLGGIGKTELARRYIQKYCDEYDNNLIWISAQTEETMTESFRRLATDHLKLSTVNVDGKEKAITSTVDEVYNYFQEKRSLFAFDNAENAEHMQKFLPFRVSNPPYLLITSRDREWTFSAKSFSYTSCQKRMLCNS